MRSTWLKAAVIGLGLVLLLGGALGAYALSGGVQQPTVEDVSVRWGEVTQETSIIRATVVIENPNPFGIPGVIDIGYEASLNDVTIAEGRKRGVGLSPGRNELELAIPVENEKISDWWVTHVNNGERSTLTIQPTVEGPLGLSYALPAQQQTVETDVLGALAGQGRTEVVLAGEPLLTVSDWTAAWGDANGTVTPVTLTAQVTNAHDRPVTLDGVGYRVEMNDVTLGEGVDRSGFSVDPGETETLEIRAALRTERFDRWWVSHLRHDETTTLSIGTTAVVAGDGDDPTVHLDLVSMQLELSTDLLGGGGATTSDRSTQVGPRGLEPPSADIAALAWGDVSEAVTELEATVAVRNPNTRSALNELVDLTIRQRATVNGVPVANGTAAIEDLPAGQSNVTVTAELDNGKVPTWWARHVNNGESSTVTVNATALVDLGATVIERPLSVQDRRFSTDLLAGMNRDLDRTLAVRGRTVATVLSTDAAWGHADAQAAPIDASVTLRNERRRVPLSVSDVSYAITMNDVTVANGTDPASVTLRPGRTGTLEFTMVLDSGRMDEWWVSHVENGERTALNATVTVTLEAGGETERVTLDLLGGNATIETDVLGVD
ncbi:MAG: LEA type 2 family protein [Halobacteriales archaeon]